VKLDFPRPKGFARYSAPEASPDPALPGHRHCIYGYVGYLWLSNVLSSFHRKPPSFKRGERGGRDASRERFISMTDMVIGMELDEPSPASASAAEESRHTLNTTVTSASKRKSRREVTGCLTLNVHVASDC